MLSCEPQQRGNVIICRYHELSDKEILDHLLHRQRSVLSRYTLCTYQHRCLTRIRNSLGFGLMAKSVILLQWHKVFLDLAGILRRQERLSCTDTADSPHYSVIEHLLLLGGYKLQHNTESLQLLDIVSLPLIFYEETATFRAQSGKALCKCAPACVAHRALTWLHPRYDKRIKPPVSGSLRVNISVVLLSLSSPDESSLVRPRYAEL